MRAALFALVLQLASAHAEKLDLRSSELYLQRLDGKPTRLRPYAGKKLTLVNLWATWCGPCKQEMPALAEIRRRYRDRGVEIVGIALDKSPPLVRSFLAKNKPGYPILLATERTVPALGELENVPTSLLLAADGSVLEVLVGALDIAALSHELDEMLKK